MFKAELVFLSEATLYRRHRGVLTYEAIHGCRNTMVIPDAGRKICIQDAVASETKQGRNFNSKPFILLQNKAILGSIHER